MRKKLYAENKSVKQRFATRKLKTGLTSLLVGFLAMGTVIPAGTSGVFADTDKATEWSHLNNLRNDAIKKLNEYKDWRNETSVLTYKKAQDSFETSRHNLMNSVSEEEINSNYKKGTDSLDEILNNRQADITQYREHTLSLLSAVHNKDFNNLYTSLSDTDKLTARLYIVEAIDKINGTDNTSEMMNAVDECYSKIGELDHSNMAERTLDTKYEALNVLNNIKYSDYTDEDKVNKILATARELIDNAQYSTQVADYLSGAQSELKALRTPEKRESDSLEAQKKSFIKKLKQARTKALNRAPRVGVLAQENLTDGTRYYISKIITASNSMEGYKLLQEYQRYVMTWNGGNELPFPEEKTTKEKAMLGLSSEWNSPIYLESNIYGKGLTINLVKEHLNLIQGVHYIKSLSVPDISYKRNGDIGMTVASFNMLYNPVSIRQKISVIPTEDTITYKALEIEKNKQQELPLEAIETTLPAHENLDDELTIEEAKSAIRNLKPTDEVTIDKSPDLYHLTEDGDSNKAMVSVKREDGTVVKLEIPCKIRGTALITFKFTDEDGNEYPVEHKIQLNDLQSGYSITSNKEMDKCIESLWETYDIENLDKDDYYITGNNTNAFQSAKSKYNGGVFRFTIDIRIAQNRNFTPKHITIYEDDTITEEMVRNAIDGLRDADTIQITDKAKPTDGFITVNITTADYQMYTVKIPVTVKSRTPLVPVTPIPTIETETVYINRGDTTHRGMPITSPLVGILNLPNDTTAEIIEDIDTNTATSSSQIRVVKVTFANGSSRIVKIPFYIRQIFPWTPVVPIPEIAKDSIIKETIKIKGEYDLTDNIRNLPKGTKITQLDKIDTSTAKSGIAKVKVTFENGSSRIVEIPYEIIDTSVPLTPITPISKVETKPVHIYKGDKLNDRDGLVNVSEDATIKILKDVDTRFTGTQLREVKVTFPDGSSRIVIVTVSIKDKTPLVPITPIADIETETVTIHKNDKLTEKAGLKDLPENTKIEILEDVDTEEVGTHTRKVKVTFDNGSSRIVEVAIIVKDRVPLTPITPIDNIETETVNVNKGDKLTDETGLVNVPEDTKIEILEDVNTEEVGTHTRKVKVTFENGSSRIVEVAIIVKDRVPLTPITPIDNIETETVTIYKGDKLTDETGVKLPEGATVKVLEDVNTEEVGTHTRKVKVTFENGSSRIVEVAIIVKDRVPLTPITPIPEVEVKPITIKQYQSAKPTDGIELSEGANAEIVKDINSAEVGTHTRKVKVTFDNGSSRIVEVAITVEKATPLTPVEPIPNIKANTITIEKGDKLDRNSLFIDLPEDATTEIIEDVDTETVGTQTIKVKVTFANGSSRIVEVPIIVKDKEPVPPAVKMVKLTIKITDKDNQPINGAVAEVIADGKVIVRNVTTNADGTATVDVEEGSTVTVNMLKSDSEHDIVQSPIVVECNDKENNAVFTVTKIAGEEPITNDYKPTEDTNTVTVASHVKRDTAVIEQNKTTDKKTENTTVVTPVENNTITNEQVKDKKETKSTKNTEPVKSTDRKAKADTVNNEKDNSTEAVGLAVAGVSVATLGLLGIKVKKFK